MNTKPHPLLRRGLILLALLMIGVSLAAGPVAMQTPDTPLEPQAQSAAPQQNADPDAPAPAPQQPGAASAQASGTVVAIIPMEGEIYGFTLQSLKRRVDRAVADGASVIVFEIDTYGGLVTDAIEVAKYIKRLQTPTVAWINDKAYSAGILIASAADEIVMAPSASAGASTPIAQGQQLGDAERAKILGPILSEYQDNAQRHGYEYVIFHAMTVLGVEVYEIENPTTGEHRLVNQADYNVMVRGQSTDAANRQGSSFFGIPTGGNNQQSQVGAPRVDIATEADRGQWQLVDTIHDGRSAMTVNDQKAKAIGLSEATIANDTELVQHLGAGRVFRVDQTWSETMAGYLTSPMVRGVLIVALLIGAYIEFQSPGLGLGGAVAVTALTLLLGAPLVVGLAEVWHIIVFFIGLALLITELIFVPGFGLIGVGGLVLMFVGLVLMAVPTGGGPSYGPVTLPPAVMWDRLVQSLLYSVLAIIVSFVGFYFLTRYFGRLPVFNRLILENEPVFAGAGGIDLVQRPDEEVSGDEVLGDSKVRINATGRVTTGLRPSGQAEFAGHVVDVVSFGQWVEPGRSVRIVEIHGNRIVVEPVDGQ